MVVFFFTLQPGNESVKQIYSHQTHHFEFSIIFRRVSYSYKLRSVVPNLTYKFSKLEHFNISQVYQCDLVI